MSVTPNISSTPLNSANENYLWQTRVPRWNSAIGLGLCSVVSGILIGLLVLRGGEPGNIFVNIVVWFFAVATFYGVFAYGMLVLRPPIAIAASANGLITFARVDRADYKSSGFLIPWREIESFSYLRYTVWGQSVVHALVIHLRPEHAAMPLEKISLQKEPDALYLTAWSKSEGERMVADLIPLLRQYS